MPDDPTVSDKARALHARALVWDNTIPWYHLPGDEKLMDRMRPSGVDAISLTVATDSDNAAATLHKIAKVRKFIADDADNLVQAFSVEDVEAARKAGKLAIILHFQGTNPFEGDPGLVALFYELGVRHALLAYNVRNFVADGCAESADAGLSRAGVAILKEMDRIGMIIDGTHSGRKSTFEAIDIASGPMVFSHSNARRIFDHFRNIDDDQIKACAATGGVIGINGVGCFLAEDETTATCHDLFAHIDYMAELVGWQHVGIGTDYVGNLKANADSLSANSWPANRGRPLPPVPQNFFPPEKLILLTELMVQRGYPEEAIMGILGGNFARVSKQVWK